MIDEKQILKLVKKLMEFPFPQICTHAVASDLLTLLDQNGYNVSKELAHAVVFAENEEAIRLINASF